ncbi:MAG: CcmD family protein [Proteobacteria bacterium]|nr:CcmD family protein [Pseudomonadota bacterium]
MNEVPNTFQSLFIGYSAIWAIMVVYLFALVRRVSKLEKRLAQDSFKE